MVAVDLTGAGLEGRLSDRAAWLLDRAELHALFDRYLRVADEDRFDDLWLRSIFTEDIAVDYTFVSHRGLPGMAEFARRFFARFERVQHAGANCLFDVAGNRAMMRANVVATHVPSAAGPAVHFRVGGVYEADAVRASAGWRFSRLKLNIVWTSGAMSAG